VSTHRSIWHVASYVDLTVGQSRRLRGPARAIWGGDYDFDHAGS
jgi:hypothetical protein